ncbi:MAG: hypothetical protein KA385_01445 [Vicinamibacteria bacterium]|jgi:hypothetical protein|nr:hypothetical protein [Vicinamibacteria bacterium]
MPSVGETSPVSRRRLIEGGALLTAAAILGASTGKAVAKDYVSRREALDDLDRLAALCGMRLGRVRSARASAERLTTRFLSDLRRYQANRDDVRRRFGLPAGLDPATQMAEVEGDLRELRQALDDLMIAYAESLPVFGDAQVVSRLAIDMVDVSRLRTVIDLWVEAEAA